MADSLHTAAQSCAIPISFNTSINPLVGAANRAAQAPPWRTDSGFCFYHARFGDRARKCRLPCNFRGKSTTQSVNAVDSGHTGCLLFITDNISGQDFL